MMRRFGLGRSFCNRRPQHHERFLAMAFVESFGTLDWLRNKAAGRYDVRELGAFDGVKVMEFVPRDETREQTRDQAEVSR